VVAPSRAVRDRRSAQPAALRKRAAIRLLKDAITGERLAVHYQPLVDARSRRPVGVEALLRWREPPDAVDELPRLVAAAERSPVIFQLERWALERCGRDVSAWPEPLGRLRVNVNVSAREFDHGGFASRLARLVRKTGVDPARVSLEITETSAMRAPEAVGVLLDGLKGQGFEVWLDDFGTGHSSLAWLRHLPIDGLKIPSDFVVGVSSNPRLATIASTILDLAHALGLRVVGEGVETEADLEWLAARGCDQLQGFLLAPALSSDALAARLASELAAPA
jgi:EAL domain-containing protein (putative c-di-GMP-specific phosphodiesterase class I)